MSNNVIQLTTMANPNIKKVLQEFLGDHKHLSIKTFRKYERVIELFESHLNNYEYESLAGRERELFEKYYDLEGKEHKGFCDLFGPDKIIGGFGMFLSYFMVRKVMAGEELKRAAGTVTKKLSKWLSENGYVSSELAKKGEEKGTQAAKLLPKAEKAGRMLYDFVRPDQFNLNDFDDEDYLEFDHYTISQMEPGKIWFEYHDCTSKGIKNLGPIIAPKSVTALLQKEWEISCAFGRVRNKWQMVEVGNVYPN